MFDLSDLSKQLIIAHRGANIEAPENTLRGFGIAIDLGADFVEFDIHFSKDRELVVIHDSSVDRTTNGTGKVIDLTVDELKHFDAGQGEEIPTFQEVINLCKGKIGMQIEIKESGMAGATLEIINKNGIQDQVLISSFKHNELEEIHAMSPETPTATLEPSGVGWATQWISTRIWPSVLSKNAQSKGAIATHPFALVVTDRMIQKATKRHIRVHPWTVDDPDRMKRLLKWGVHGLITNDPRTLRELV